MLSLSSTAKEVLSTIRILYRSLFRVSHNHEVCPIHRLLAVIQDLCASVQIILVFGSNSNDYKGVTFSRLPVDFSFAVILCFPEETVTEYNSNFTAVVKNS